MEEQKQEPEPTVAAAPEVVPLDDAAIEAIAELDQRQLILNASLNAILNYFSRQHKLQGRWELSDNRKELVKQAP